MREHLQLGPFDSSVRLPFFLGLELNRGLVDTVHIHSEETVSGGGAGFEGSTIEEGLYKAGRLCCRSSIAHQVAFCQAMEEALGIDVDPEMGLFRVLVAELERITAHLEVISDVARCIEDGLMFSGAVKYIQEIRSNLAETSGNPFGFGLIVPGGVFLKSGTGEGIPVYHLSKTISALVRDVGFWTGKLRLMKRRFGSAGLDRSLIPDGAMTAPAFRASGFGGDRRKGEEAYGAYRSLAADVEIGGDGLTLDRLLVLLGEIVDSAGLIREVYKSGWSAFDGPTRVEAQSGKGMGFSEGPHGAIEYHVVVDSRAVIRKCRLYTAATDVAGVIPWVLQGIPYKDVVISLLSFSPCPFCLEG